jgi:hypothetical protein
MTEQNSYLGDQEKIKSWFAQTPDTETVAGFVPVPGIHKLDMHFDIDKLREALKTVTQITDFDASGRYWLRPDDRYIEEPREELVDEAAFSEFVSDYAGTYFEHVHAELSRLTKIGRMRVLSKGLYNCNSWHRDPEPRLHIPIISNPGSVFVVNNHCTHLPADGSVYFTDTRGYHTAFNGGLYQRVHIVAAMPL